MANLTTNPEYDSYAADSEEFTIYGTVPPDGAAEPRLSGKELNAAAGVTGINVTGHAKELCVNKLGHTMVTPTEGKPEVYVMHLLCSVKNSEEEFSFSYLMQALVTWPERIFIPIINKK